MKNFLLLLGSKVPSWKKCKNETSELDGTFLPRKGGLCHLDMTLESWKVERANGRGGGGGVNN